MFPPRVASALLTVWYAVLMLLVLLSAHAPPAPFRYGGV